MMLFKNAGLIDLTAVTTMGVTAKLPGSFGYFGTGLKYAIARCLRGGGTITILRGTQDAVTFTKKPVEVREANFDVVWMLTKTLGRKTTKRVPMGFTTQLGRDWEPWMVLREIGCNALDEGGTISVVENDTEVVVGPNETAIFVDWPEMEEVWVNPLQVFFSLGDVHTCTPEIQVSHAPSDFLYYRGIRVQKREGGSVFTYNVLKEQSLTEDRTLKWDFCALREIVRFWIKDCEDPEALLLALTAPEKTLEGRLKYDEYEMYPSRVFIDVVLSHRADRKQPISQSAKNLVLKHLRRNASQTVRVEEVSDRMSQIVESLTHAGIPLDKVDIVTVDELPGELRSLAEHGRIFLLKSLHRASRWEIANELVRRYVDLRCTGEDEIQDLLVPLVIRHGADILAPETIDPESIRMVNDALLDVGVSAHEDLPF